MFIRLMDSDGPPGMLSLRRYQNTANLTTTVINNKNEPSPSLLQSAMCLGATYRLSGSRRGTISASAGESVNSISSNAGACAQQWEAITLCVSQNSALTAGGGGGRINWIHTDKNSKCSMWLVVMSCCSRPSLICAEVLWCLVHLHPFQSIKRALQCIP